MLGMSYTSCSLNLLPGIECPLCRNRLYRTFPKKSTPFSKIFPEVHRDHFSADGAVKWKFSTNPRSTKNCTKGGDSVAFRLSLLCKRIMNGGNFSTWVESCGQLLWRSMWRMWKTPCFPQLLAPIPCGWIGGKLCIPLCITRMRMALGVDYVTACIQKFPDKKAPYVGICSTLTGV